MKNSLAITLLLGLTLTINNLHALTKTRAFAQAATTAANYVRHNKLKTAGMVIGGVIALDALQVGARWIWWRIRRDDTKIKAAQEAIEKADKAADETREKWRNLHQDNDAERSVVLEADKADERAMNARFDARSAYKKLLFYPQEASIICIPLLEKLVQQVAKFHAWRHSRKARRGN